jgi:hypothetical protein
MPTRFPKLQNKANQYQTLLQAKNNVPQHEYMKMHPTATKNIKIKFTEQILQQKWHLIADAKGGEDAHAIATQRPKTM